MLTAAAVDDVVLRVLGERLRRPFVQLAALERQQLPEHGLAHQAVPEGVVGALDDEDADVDGLADGGAVAVAGVNPDAMQSCWSGTQSPKIAARPTSCAASGPRLRTRESSTSLTRREPGSFTSSPSRYGLPCVCSYQASTSTASLPVRAATSSRVSSRSRRCSSTQVAPGSRLSSEHRLLDAAEPRGLVVPEREHEAQPAACRGGRQVDEEVAGGLVGPLQVVDDDRGRASGSRRAPVRRPRAGSP